MVVIRKALLPADKELKEMIARFGREKLAIEIDMKADFQNAGQLDSFYDLGFGTAILKHIDTTKSFSDAIAGTKIKVMWIVQYLLFK